MMRMDWMSVRLGMKRAQYVSQVLQPLNDGDWR